MALLRTLRISADKVASAFGLDVQPLSDGSGICGVQLVRHRDDSSSQMRGSLVDFYVGGKEISFFVENELDFVQREHLARHFYEQDELQIISKHFFGGTFIDVGANVGNHSIYMAKCAGASRIIAFEPNPKAFRVLKTNMRLNGIDFMELHNVGLGRSSLRASIHATRFNLGSGFLTPSEEGPITVVSGDSILADVEKIDMIKIDTEGFELEVLGGLSITLAKRKPKIFIEVECKNESEFFGVIAGHDYKVLEQFKRYDASTNYLIA